MRKEHTKLQKLIVIVGPTAAGKTAWSLKLAKKFDGEIIYADSRQIYKKMNIGTAKPAGKWQWNRLRKTFFIDDIAHYLIDFLDPGKKFTVAQFRDSAIKFTKLIHSHNRVPILSGGTGLYIQSVVDNYVIPRVPANKELRASLQGKTNDELLYLLGQLDPDILKVIDKKNKRRLIRALEVCIFTGIPFSAQRQKSDPLFDILMIGVDVPREELYDRINKRVDEMIELGLEEEVRGLVNQKYGWERSSMQGIGYRQFKEYLDGEKTIEEVIENLKRDTRRLARRQMTWFKRDDRITWISEYEEAEKLVREFLNNENN